MKPSIHLLPLVICAGAAIALSMTAGGHPASAAAGVLTPRAVEQAQTHPQAVYRTIPGLPTQRAQRPSGGPSSYVAPGHFRQGPGAGVGNSPGSAPLAPPPAPPPGPSLTVGTTVEGLANPNGGTPPDTQVAVGPTEIIEMVNNTAEIWPKTGGPPIATLDLNTLFVIPELVGSDPRVLYDAQSGRFFATYISFNPPPYNAFYGNDTTIQILWSLNSPPTSASDWNGCSYVDTSGQLHDNPALGVSDDKIAIGSDVFAWPAAASDPNLAPLGADTLLLDKSIALANQTPCPTGYFTNVSAGNIRPAQSLSATSTLYMASLPESGGTFATLWAVSGNKPLPHTHGSPDGGHDDATRCGPVRHCQRHPDERRARAGGGLEVRGTDRAVEHRLRLPAPLMLALAADSDVLTRRDPRAHDRRTLRVRPVLSGGPSGRGEQSRRRLHEFLGKHASEHRSDHA